MALQTFYCNLESTSASRCSITIPKIGDATLGIRLHACSTPMQLDLTIEMLHTVWLLTFVLSNSNEYRIIGFDYWPLLVDMNWSDRQVQICLESVKSGDRLCLANDTLPEWDRYDCAGIKEALRKRSPSIAMLVLLCLFISVVMVYLVFLSLRVVFPKLCLIASRSLLPSKGIIGQRFLLRQVDALLWTAQLLRRFKRRTYLWTPAVTLPVLKRATAATYSLQR